MEQGRGYVKSGDLICPFEKAAAGERQKLGNA